MFKMLDEEKVTSRTYALFYLYFLFKKHLKHLNLNKQTDLRKSLDGEKIIESVKKFNYRRFLSVCVLFY